MTDFQRGECENEGLLTFRLAFDLVRPAGFIKFSREGEENPRPYHR